MITVYRVEYNGNSYLDNEIDSVNLFVDSLNCEYVITECEIDEATFWALDEYVSPPMAS